MGKRSKREEQPPSSESEDFSEDDFSDSEGSISSEGSGSEASFGTVNSRAHSTLRDKRKEIESNLRFLDQLARKVREKGEAFDDRDAALVSERRNQEKDRLRRLTALEEQFSRKLNRLSDILNKRESTLDRLSATREGKQAFANMPDLLQGLVGRQCELEAKYQDLSSKVADMLAQAESV